MTSKLQAVARAIVPDRPYDALSFAARRLVARGVAPGEHAALDRAFVVEHGSSVRGGPFAGMRHDPSLIGHTTAVAAKLLGAYELELHPAIRRILGSGMSTFVDIGCAEGYYAVGVALRRPDVKVVAFDIDPAARRMCRLLARRNRVSVDTRGAATIDDVASLEPRTVLFSDCEGAEALLLDPSRAVALAGLAIIAEIHDFVDPAISGLLRARFERTHEIDEVMTTRREPARYPELASFADADRVKLLSEGRPAMMSWYIMEPR